MNAHDSALNVLRIAGAADAAWFRDELAYAWRTAEYEASLAYEAWREAPGSIGYAVYRAAQDRADQAQDVFAYNASVRPSATAQIP